MPVQTTPKQTAPTRATYTNPFSMGDVHAWDVSTGVYLSDERTGKKLHSFKTWDDAINWLWLDGAKDVARARNAHKHGRN